jgi:eukaryotic-like serine/threonine-protein kinase
MEFELGQTYAGYKFLDVARRSVSGVEYRVQNTLAQRMELLKVLPPGARSDSEETERFMREMPVRASLVHPNIVTFFTALPLEGRLVMTTELVEGLPLSERLQMGPLSWREAVDFARQVLSAVDWAHQRQIVHRDISPANIIALPGGVVKLTNFRLTKSIAASLKYISPEQAKGSEAADHRSDLYSIGIVLYEMLAGRTPFNSASQFELMLAHVNQQPEPASNFNSTVPPQLDAVVLKALTKFPSDRYQSAAEFDEALVEAIAGIAPAEIAPAPEPVAAPAVALAPDIQPESIATSPVTEVVAEEEAELALEPVAAAVLEPPSAIEPEPVADPVIAEPAIEEAVIAEPVIEEVVIEEAAIAEPEVAEAAAEIAPAIEPESIAVPIAAEAAPEPVVVAVELAPAIEPEVVDVPVAAEAVPETVLLPVAELPPVIEPETAVVLAIAGAAPERVSAAAEMVPAIEPEPVAVAEPEIAEAAIEPEPVAAFEIAETEAEPAAPSPSADPVAAVVEAEAGQPEPQFEAQPEPLSEAQSQSQASPVGPAMPPPVLLPETAVHASLWTAAEVVSRAAQSSGAPSLAAPPTPPAPVPVATPAVAALSGTVAPEVAPVSQPTPAATNPALSPYGVPEFLAAAKTQSESVQWAFFGGTAAFLGVIWTAIWLFTGK